MSSHTKGEWSKDYLVSDILKNEFTGCQIRIVTPVPSMEVYYLVGRKSELFDWAMISETVIKSSEEAERQARATLRNQAEFWNDLHELIYTQFFWVPFNRARGYLKGYFDIITTAGREIENLYPNAGFFTPHDGHRNLRISERQVRFIRCSDGGYAPELCRCPRHRNFAAYQSNRRNF